MFVILEEDLQMDKLNINAIIGIDPGASGGICLWRKDLPVELHKMPKDLQQLKDWLEYIKTICKPIVFLEKLSVRPDDVAVTDNKANMGKLFRIQRMIANYEQLKATISFSGVPYILVHPMSWQSRLKIRIKGEEKPERKKRYKDIASQMYPQTRQTMWSCDATLIMHFGRVVLANDIKWVKANLPNTLHEKLF